MAFNKMESSRLIKIQCIEHQPDAPDLSVAKSEVVDVSSCSEMHKYARNSLRLKADAAINTK